MNKNKKISILIGILFFIATFSYAIGSSLIETNLNAEDVLSVFYPNKGKIILGVILELINAISVVVIAILIFKLLKEKNKKIVKIYLITRLLESLFLVFSIFSVLFLINLSKHYNNFATSFNLDTMQNLTNLSINLYSSFFEIAMIVLGIGSIIFCYYLFKEKLIPQSISIIGILGYIGLILWGILSFTNLSSSLYFFIPGAIFEIIFPLWLIFKGFKL